MTPDLSIRISRAFARGKPWPKDRESILRAARKARNFGDLPDKIQGLINSLAEGRAGIVDREGNK